MSTNLTDTFKRADIQENVKINLTDTFHGLYLLILVLLTNFWSLDRLLTWISVHCVAWKSNNFGTAVCSAFMLLVRLSVRQESNCVNWNYATLYRDLLEVGGKATDMNSRQVACLIWDINFQYHFKSYLWLQYHNHYICNLLNRYLLLLREVMISTSSSRRGWTIKTRWRE